MYRLRYLILLLLCIVHLPITAQIQDSIQLSFQEYLGYVKKFHPVARQANLTVDAAQAELLKSRGAFDPKIDVDYDRKKFKDIEYYDKLNATFKIPTWFGIEVKGNFEQNDGEFLNPEGSVPDDGLYSAGVSVPVGRGLWINERMATLRKAKLFQEQTAADRQLLVNQILYDASLAYFDWLQAFNEKEIYENFLENANIRFVGIKKRAIAGDIPLIDTLEAGIIVQNRRLSLEQAKIKLVKRGLDLATFLWLGDNIPVELQPDVIPEIYVEETIDETLNIENVPLSDFTLENHPKIRSLNYKIQGLEVDRRLKANKLLPKINLEYNFITPTPDIARTFNTDEYKAGINFEFPLFLRKERGDLRLAKIKVRDAAYDLELQQIQIENKIIGFYRELESFVDQNALIISIVRDYQALLQGEERKFSFGESSVFLINSRESKLIDAQLKRIEVQNKFLTTKAKLFNSLAIEPEDL